MVEYLEAEFLKFGLCSLMRRRPRVTGLQVRSKFGALVHHLLKPDPTPTVNNNKQDGSQTTKTTPKYKMSAFEIC